jgi:hypothetical protein
MSPVVEAATAWYGNGTNAPLSNPVKLGSQRRRSAIVTRGSGGQNYGLTRLTGMFRCDPNVPTNVRSLEIPTFEAFGLLDPSALSMRLTKLIRQVLLFHDW